MKYYSYFDKKKFGITHIIKLSNISDKFNQKTNRRK